MYDSHAYPAYAPEPGSRRLPRPVGDRRLGVAAAVAGVLVGWLLLSAVLPDVGHTIRLALADLSAEVHLTPEAGSPDPAELAELARRRMEASGLLHEIVVSDETVSVPVGPDDEAEARRWVLPQGKLELLYASDAPLEERDALIQGVLNAKAADEYDPYGPLDALPHPYEDHYVLLVRPVNLPPSWLASIELDADEDGQPVFDTTISAGGFPMVKTLEMEARNRDIAAVLDGKLISLNRSRIHPLLPYLEVDPGPLAWDADALQRALTQIRTRYPVRLRDAP